MFPFLDKWQTVPAHQSFFNILMHVYVPAGGTEKFTGPQFSDDEWAAVNVRFLYEV